MQKPNDYDNSEAKTFEGFDNPPSGPYVMGICAAFEGKTANQDPKLVISLDIAKGKYKNFYRDLSDKIGKDCFVKLHQGTEGKATPYFKGAIKAIEESNQGYKFNFDEKTLPRKFVGAMLKESFYTNSAGEEKSVLKVAYLCSVAKAESGSLKIPEPERASNQQQNSHSTNDNTGPSFTDDDCPF